MGDGEHQAAHALSAKTVLIADDSVTIRRVVELCFVDTNVRVAAAGSGIEAMRKIELLHPDLVIADVVMAEPTGYDICRAVKASAHPVPVLLLAGTFEPYDSDLARDCGADGCLVKPFDSRTLVETVQRLLTADSGAEPPSDEGWPSDAPILEERVTPDADAGRPEEPALPAADARAVDEPSAPLVSEPRPRQPLATPLSDDDLDALARAVVARLSDAVLREIAWDVVPDLAERIVRERLRELEREEDEVR